MPHSAHRQHAHNYKHERNSRAPAVPRAMMTAAAIEGRSAGPAVSRCVAGLNSRTTAQCTAAQLTFDTLEAREQLPHDTHTHGRERPCLPSPRHPAAAWCPGNPKPAMHTIAVSKLHPAMQRPLAPKRQQGTTPSNSDNIHAHLSATRDPTGYRREQQKVVVRVQPLNDPRKAVGHGFHAQQHREEVPGTMTRKHRPRDVHDDLARHGRRQRTRT